MPHRLLRRALTSQPSKRTDTPSPEGRSRILSRFVFCALGQPSYRSKPLRQPTRLLSIIIFLPLIFVAPPPLSWTQVNVPGFGEHPPPYAAQEAFDLAIFNDQLYLGMEGRVCARIWRSRSGVVAPSSQADWEQVVSDGFDGTVDCAASSATTDNDHIDSLEPFRGYLYASTAMQTPTQRGTQVWRSASGDAGTWVRVNQPGFGQRTNENFKDMIEFQGLLCGGTSNPGGVSAAGVLIRPGAQVWCTDGLTPDPAHAGALHWTQRNLDGFGHIENVKVWSSAVYDGALYFGVEARAMNGSIWRTRDIDDPNAWEKVFAPDELGVQAARVDVLQGFKGNLYIGMAVSGKGTQIYRSKIGDRDAWRPVVSDGFGFTTTGRFISDASAILDDVLYVAVLDEIQGVGIWRTTDGAAWIHAAPYGLGAQSTFAAELSAFHGYLYAWTSDHVVGQGVWQGRYDR